VRVVKEYPIPSTTRQLKGFLGLAGYYRRFILNFSKTAKPLTELLKRNRTFMWDQRTNKACNTLKKLLTEESLLQYPDFTKPCVLTTDTSNEVLGAILSQGPIGQDLPVAYASRTLSNAEKNYSTTEKELLAIVWGCRQYRQYLFGRKFTIVTDHQLLTWVFNVKDPSSRLLRWRLKLEEFDYRIVYKPGIRNTNADALSRINTAEINPALETSSVLTEEEKIKILREFHEQPIGGHLGMNRIFGRLKQYISWPGMKKEIEDYRRQCEVCQKYKITQNKTKLPLQITDTPDMAWQKCSMDIVGPLTPTLQDNKYLLTFQDGLSKFTIAVPIKQQDARTLARAFVEEIILKFGIPQVLLTEQGSNFLNELFSNVCKLLRVKPIKTSTYRPQTNGALERTHRVLVEYFRCYILDNQTDWDHWIYATFVFNTTPHSGTSFTPFELLFGRKPNIPGILQEPVEIRYNYDSYVRELQSRLQSCYNVARSHLNAKKEKSKEYYDRNTNVPLFAVGEKVLLHDEKVRHGRSAKLSPPFIDPYKIIAVEDVNVTLRLPRNKTLRVHCNRLKPFFA
jgi:transposase InsO family protein